MITSIFPTLPITSELSSLFTVPLSLDGTLLTCAAYGWPTPTVSWLRNGQQLTEGSILSRTTSANNSAYVSASLIWQDGFLESDAGSYECVVHVNDTHYSRRESKTVSLKAADPVLQSFSPSPCQVQSSEISFQLRVSNVDCSEWRSDVKDQVTSSILRTILSVVAASCQDCPVVDSVTVEDDLKCVEQQGDETAVLFSGRVEAEDSSQTELIFCALRRWQESGPLLQVNDQYYLLDESCAIEAESSAGRECAASGLQGISSASSLPSIRAIVTLTSLAATITLLTS